MANVHDPALVPPRHNYAELPQYKQYQPDPVPAIQPYMYSQYQQSAPDNSYSMLQDQQQHFHGFAGHQAQGYQQQSYIAPDAWRQWAESAQTHDMNGTPVPKQDYLHAANTMVALGGHQDLGGSMQGQGGAEQATYGLQVSNAGMRHPVGPFPHMIQDATIHAALNEGWNVPQSGQFSGHMAPRGHGQNMQNGEQQ